jgi:hypothetical protein
MLMFVGTIRALRPREYSQSREGMTAVVGVTPVSPASPAARFIPGNIIPIQGRSWRASPGDAGIAPTAGVATR